MHQQMYEAIRNGIANGSKKVDDVLAGISEIIVRGWSIRYKPEPVRSDYHSRAGFPHTPMFPRKKHCIYMDGRILMVIFWTAQSTTTP